VRIILAAACLLAFAGTAAAQSNNWTYRYDASAGLATAQSRDGGNLSATFTCRPPDGQLVITDYTLGRRRVNQAQVRVGDMTITVPARQDRVGRDRVLVISLPQAPPILASALSPSAAMSITAGGRSHTLQEGAGTRLRDVAYNCWPQQ